VVRWLLLHAEQLGCSAVLALTVKTVSCFPAMLRAVSAGFSARSGCCTLTVLLWYEAIWQNLVHVCSMFCFQHQAHSCARQVN
jgi:hypothetical protein